MNAISNLSKIKKFGGMALVGLLAAAVAIKAASAATSTGTALQPAFDALNDLTNGYGKQLLVLIGFVGAGLAMLASQAMGAIMKFIGFVVFLAVGFSAAITLSGALI
jgi:hypothetical protein